jgi:hypothetical protein
MSRPYRPPADCSRAVEKLAPDSSRRRTSSRSNGYESIRNAVKTPSGHFWHKSVEITQLRFTFERLGHRLTDLTAHLTR